MDYVLDILTLFFVCGIVSISLTLPMIYASLRHKSCPGFHIWTFGFIVNGIGMILLIPSCFQDDPNIQSHPVND